MSGSTVPTNKEASPIPYDNLKIEVQFDRSSKHLPNNQNQYVWDDKDWDDGQGAPLGLHEKDPNRHPNQQRQRFKEPKTMPSEKVSFYFLTILILYRFCYNTTLFPFWFVCIIILTL